MLRSCFSGSPLPVRLRAAATSLSATATMMVCLAVAPGSNVPPTGGGRSAQVPVGDDSW
jgi:hypothetical protein